MNSLKNVEFLTTAEVAEKLKLHPQVILRKLNGGEIPGYKLGKEWRVASHELWAWLQKQANTSRPSNRETTLGNFLHEGRLKRVPVQRRKRVFVLEHLERGRGHHALFHDARERALGVDRPGAPVAGSIASASA